MKSPEETIAFIASRIGHIYHRPLMYGGTADGVDLVLHYYHELWAEIVERHRDFRKAESTVSDQERCNSHNFASRYRVDHPRAEDKEIADYVVAQWRKVSGLLGVPIPYDQIIQELERDLGPKEQWQF